MIPNHGTAGGARRSRAEPSRAEGGNAGAPVGRAGQGRAQHGPARPGLSAPLPGQQPPAPPSAAGPPRPRPAPPMGSGAGGGRQPRLLRPTRPGPALAGEGSGSVTQPSPPSGPGAAQRFAVHFGETLQGAGGPWRVCEQWGRREGAARPRPQRVHQSSTVQQSTAINNKIPCRFFWQPKSKEGKGVAVGRRCRATRSTTGPIRHGATLGSR